jgi:hypothetical protein
LHQAASILHNEAQLNQDGVRRRFQGLLGAMTRWKTQTPMLIGAIAHFLKVTRSYWAGLFHCYDMETLPRTNNDLEQTFGKWRHHQRRCSGQKVSPATAVTRGSVQLISALATQQQSFFACDLAMVSVAQSQQLRSTLHLYQQKRVQQRQFRQSPLTYLAQLEQKLLQLTLPP